ncbi:MexH family multidrug efflux RND transporter periplasmic adaptor subunit [Nitrospira sp. KM1]|uniref:efflux RND transporter periplasmic adaptor subunit n=1 Tax=Nitrospira sp. KM1 TaxID=1936990 RepID=UPI0013A7A5FE|nr:efflux RND transporter periplasmic adaptor subunit [Nitrospira sp. KM1]BCA56640.1 MexH family multidrug efflux RND transporter periplasmic adaptor subunit [Nitrospira sp. KM1]
MTFKRIFLTLVLLGLAGVLTLRIWDRPASESAVPAVSERTALVDISQVTLGSVTESIQAVGTLQAIASIMIRPEIAGLVRRIHFIDGQLIERMAPMVELDQEELQAQANQAVAQERIAQVTFERLKRLAAQQTTIVPAQQVDEARLALQAAAANSVLYATRLKKSILRAPFSGTVGLRRVSVGDYVQPGQDIVNLEDLHTLHVDFKVPEIWLSRLSNDQSVQVTTDAFPSLVFEGHVTAIDPRVDSVNRTVSARAAVPNPDGKLRPGLFATVGVKLGQDVHALLIPEEAVFMQKDKAMVFRIEDNIARLTEVTVGVHAQGMVQIRSGLTEGSSVVRTGTHKIRDGMRLALK